MEELSKIAERIWKLFPHFKDEVTVKKLITYTGLRKSSIYNALDELKSGDYIDYDPENHSWVIKSVTKEKPLKENTSEVRLLDPEMLETYQMLRALEELNPELKNDKSMREISNALRILSGAST